MRLKSEGGTRRARVDAILSACLCLSALGLALSTSDPPPSSSYRGGRHQGRVPLNTSATRRDETGLLNIHLVPHTHDDAGWLKTVDQYYYGANNTIQVAGVQYIIDSVVASLQQNLDRRFVYGEVAFFSRWWEEQNDHTREVVKGLVAEGRLSFVNGGYVQHDEAAAHYVGMIDQTTRGHMWLERELGLPPPRVGWQIDPFGHSKTHATMMASGAGMDAVFFGRIDHQDLEQRKRARSLEMLWRASKAYPTSDGDCFAGAFYSGNYGPPPGFNWDHGSADSPMQDDPRLADYNVEERLADFVSQVDTIAAMHRGADIMLTMGSDFQYMNANHWFRNMDSLIHHLNSHPEYRKRYNAFYSTPEDYVAAKHSSGVDWPEKVEDDFFPYSDCNHCYWSGYFTSKAASKRYIRSATAYLQVARHLEAAVGRQEGGVTTDGLEEAVSLLQHHDGITGTAKKHVVNDYHRRIAKGWAEAREVVHQAVDDLLSGGRTRSSSGGARGARPARSLRMVGNAPLKGADVSEQTYTSGNVAVLGECPLLNVSVCEITVERVSPNGHGVDVLVYNPLAWKRTTPIRVPIGDVPYVVVKDALGSPITAQIVPANRETLSLQLQEAEGEPGHAVQEVVFLADLEPLDFGIFTIRPESEEGAHTASPSHVHVVPNSPDMEAFTVSNGKIALTVDPSDGTISQLDNVAAGLSTPLDHRLMWYRSSNGEEEEDHGQASGAYIFRPAGVYNASESGKLLLELVAGPVVSEVRQSHSSWASVTHRLWRGQDYVEAEWTVGPIPIEDGVGREVVSRWRSGIASGKEFWTDANGREMMARTRDHRSSFQLNVTEPVAGNFYPVTAAAAVRDNSAAVELFVITDRAQAAASLEAGQMEFMVHRRTAMDDRRGVDEPISETTCNCHDCSCPVSQGLTIRGTHLLSLQPLSYAAEARRTLQQEANDPPVVIFAEGLMTDTSGRGDVPGTRQAGGEQHGVGPESDHILRPRALSLTGGVALALRSPLIRDGAALPRNVHLLTLMEKESGTLLLRLAHLYTVGEGAGALGEAVCVDLASLLGDIQVLNELSLTGVQAVHSVRRRVWGNRARKGLMADSKAAVEACKGKAWGAVLQPMNIKTWEVKLSGV